MLFPGHNLDFEMSEKKDGPMKDSPANRLAFFQKNGLEGRVVVSAGLVHGNTVAVIEKTDENPVIPGCDALITNDRGRLLTITVADCLPIYFYDEDKQAIALAHAGWRGLASDIIGAVIQAFKTNYDSRPGGIQAFIGPHIKDCHFEVQADVASHFKSAAPVSRGGKTYLNLAEIAKTRLLAAGLENDHIAVSEECTYCLENKYYSFRRDKPQKLETMIAYLGRR